MRLRPSVAAPSLPALTRAALSILSAALLSAAAAPALAAQETASAPSSPATPGTPGAQRLFYCQLQLKDAGGTTYYSSVFPADGSPIAVQDEWLAFVNERYHPGPVASSSCQTGSAAFLKQMRDLAANPKKKPAAAPIDTGWKLGG